MPDDRHRCEFTNFDQSVSVLVGGLFFDLAQRRGCDRLFDVNCRARFRGAPAALSALALSFVIGCSQAPAPLNAQEEQELERLRSESKEIQKLRAANREVDRLRKDNEELKTLRNSAAEIAKLETENNELRKQVAAARPAAPAARSQPSTQTTAQALLSAGNLPQAFEQAALIVEGQAAYRPEDVPQEGDQILIDRSVIGILIPEFANLTNTQQYEVSGWLKSKGVTIKNYQQLNTLGISNFQVRRFNPAETQLPK